MKVLEAEMKQQGWTRRCSGGCRKTRYATLSSATP
jgi:hypothetical protein